MSALYATFNSPGGAEQAAQELLQAGASSTDLSLICWPSGGMVSLVIPTGGLDRGDSEKILLRHSPIRVGDTFEAQPDGANFRPYESDFQADAKTRFQGPRWENCAYQDFRRPTIMVENWPIPCICATATGVKSRESAPELAGPLSL